MIRDKMTILPISLRSHYVTEIAIPSRRPHHSVIGLVPSESPSYHVDRIAVCQRPRPVTHSSNQLHRYSVKKGSSSTIEAKHNFQARDIIAYPAKRHPIWYDHGLDQCSSGSYSRPSGIN